MVIGDLEQHLSNLGYVIEQLTGSDGQTYLVVRKVFIASGRLAGKMCDVAVQRATANPWVPPAAIQVRPHLVPTGTFSTQATPLGADWQYWSRRFDRVPTPRGFFAHVLTVLSGV